MVRSADILFYIIFLGQIFLISYYFPRQLHARMKSVLESYPPSEYPRLYPSSVGFYSMRHSVFKMANRFIFILGFILLFLIMFVIDHAGFAEDGYISEAFPAVYGMIQFVPLVFLDFLGFRQFKQMREENRSKTRSTELHRRRLFDYVSPTLVGMTILVYLGSIFFDFYMHDFIFQWGHDTVQRTLVLTGTSVFLLAFGAWLLYGRKQDPHQSFADRTKQISANLKSMCFVSIAMGIFFMTTAADDIYELDFLDASLLSLYFQVIAFMSIGHILRSLRVEDINFEVYKDELGAI